MTPVTVPLDETKLREELIFEERRVLVPYKDSKGLWTVGIGHNLDAHGEPHDKPISDAKCEAYYMTDTRSAMADLDHHVAWWRTMTDPRQRALVNMCFQMGWGDGATHGLSTFHHTLDLLRIGHYNEAADNAMNSKWATIDSPKRAKRVTDRLR